MDVPPAGEKCPVCLETGPDLFGSNKSKRDGLQIHCRRCKKIYQDKWYAENKQRHIKNVAVHRRKNVLENYRRSYSYLKEHPCVVCGEADLYLLQYHHNQGVKHQNVSNMIVNGYKWDTIMSEIALCQVLCIRCHRKKTASDLGVLTFIERLNMGV